MVVTTKIFNTLLNAFFKSRIVCHNKVEDVHSGQEDDPRQDTDLDNQPQDVMIRLLRQLSIEEKEQSAANLIDDHDGNLGDYEDHSLKGKNLFEAKHLFN